MKKYEKPSVEIVEFSTEEIMNGETGEDWGEFSGNVEDW